MQTHKQKIKSGVLVILSLYSFFIVVQILAASFSDVTETNKYYVSIEYLKKSGVIGGYADGTFKPDNTINRAEVLKIILNGSKVEAPELTVDPTFPDVKRDDWFAKYIMKAKEIGIIKGNVDGTFAPERPVNKAELLKMLLVTNTVDLTNYQTSDQTFLDVDKTAWYFPYINFAQATGLIRFNGDAKLEPAKELSRGEVSEIMYLLIALKNQNNSKFLLEQAELEVTSAMNLLNIKQYDDAYNSADVAFDFSSQALTVDKNLDQNRNTIESAIKLSESIKQLIDSYRLIVQEGKFQEAIDMANTAKTTATEAWEKNNEVQAIAHIIKEQADSLIEQSNQYLNGSGSSTK